MRDRQPAQKQPARGARLVLMCGLPGAGKTTVAHRVAEALDAVRFAPDEWLIRLGFDGYDEAARDHIERLQWELAQELLSAGRSVILESGFWTRKDRDDKRVRARELGCSVELRYLDVPVDELWERLERRGVAGTPSAFPVERDDLLSWAEEFERPDEEELALFDRPGGADGREQYKRRMIRDMSSAETPRYDPIAEEYEAHAADSPYNAFYDRPAVLDLLGDVTGKRVLDAGCGPGFYAEDLVARGADVVAFDQSPAIVEVAKGRLGETADVRVHDLAEPLDWLEDESFDMAVLALVISHLDDRMYALREIHQILRPGGHLVISTEHPTADWLKLGGSYFTVEVVEETWAKGWEMRSWRLPLGVMCDEFRTSGFLIERVVEPQPVPEMAKRYPSYDEKLNREPGFIAFRLVKPA